MRHSKFDIAVAFVLVNPHGLFVFYCFFEVA